MATSCKDDRCGYHVILFYIEMTADGSNLDFFFVTFFSIKKFDDPKYHLSVKIISIWPPISELAAMGHAGMWTFALKVTVGNHKIKFGCKHYTCFEHLVIKVHATHTDQNVVISIWLPLTYMAAMLYTEIPLFILTHHGPTHSHASSPESAMWPGMARTRVSAGLPGSQHAYNPHFLRTSGQELLI